MHVGKLCLVFFLSSLPSASSIVDASCTACPYWCPETTSCYLDSNNCTVSCLERPCMQTCDRNSMIAVVGASLLLLGVVACIVLFVCSACRCAQLDTVAFFGRALVLVLVLLFAGIATLAGGTGHFAHQYGYVSSSVGNEEVSGGIIAAWVIPSAVLIGLAIIGSIVKVNTTVPSLTKVGIGLHLRSNVTALLAIALCCISLAASELLLIVFFGQGRSVVFDITGQAFGSLPFASRPYSPMFLSATPALLFVTNLFALVVAVIVGIRTSVSERDRASPADDGTVASLSSALASVEQIPLPQVAPGSAPSRQPYVSIDALRSMVPKEAPLGVAPICSPRLPCTAFTLLVPTIPAVAVTIACSWALGLWLYTSPPALVATASPSLTVQGGSTVWGAVAAVLAITTGCLGQIAVLGLLVVRSCCTALTYVVYRPLCQNCPGCVHCSQKEYLIPKDG